MFVLMFVFVFIVLLSNIINGSNHAKCISLRNQKVIWMYIDKSGLNHIQPTVINLHHNEYSQEFQDFQSAVKLDITCVGSCNTLNDLSNKVRRRKLFFPNKTEDFNLSVFNIIAGVNESKTLKKHLLCECKFCFDERKCNSDQGWNNDKC